MLIMRTVTVDIIAKEALALLKELEEKNLIRLHEEDQLDNSSKVDWHRFKGSMYKEPLEKVKQTLHELRNEWE